MNDGFFRRHKKEIGLFLVGLLFAVLFGFVHPLHRAIEFIDRLGYSGMFISGVMYGSGLTASLATIIFADTPATLHPILVGVLGGLGAALYDLGIFYLSRRESEHGWLATVIARVKARRNVPNWATLLVGTIILASPLPDELAAGLFGISQGRTAVFFFLSFASNMIGIFAISGIF